MRAFGKILCGLSALNGGLTFVGILIFRGWIGTDQTILSVTDQIASSRFAKRGDDDLSVFGSEILEKRSLLRFFFFCFGDEDRFFRIGIQARIEHTGRDRSGGRIEVLNLLGMQSFFFQEEGKLDGVLGLASRMGGHEVGNKILLLVHTLGQLVEAMAEFFVNLNVWLAHGVQYVV